MTLIPILMRSKHGCVELTRDIRQTVIIENQDVKLLMGLICGEETNLVGGGNEGMKILREASRELCQIVLAEGEHL